MSKLEHRQNVSHDNETHSIVLASITAKFQFETSSLHVTNILIGVKLETHHVDVNSMLIVTQLYAPSTPSPTQATPQGKIEERNSLRVYSDFFRDKIVDYPPLMRNPHDERTRIVVT